MRLSFGMKKKPDGIKNKKYSYKKMNGQIKLLIFDVEPEDTGLYRCSMIQGTFSDIKLDINGFRLLKGPKKTVCIVNGTSQLEWIVEIPLALNPSAIHVYATQSNGQRDGLYSYYLDDKTVKTVFGADCDTKEYSGISDRIIKATCFLTRENIRRFNSSYLEFDFSNYYLQTSPIHTTGECLGGNVKRTVDIGNKTVGSNLSEGKNADNGAKTAGATLGPIVGIAFFVVAIFICPH
ncbi:hypothetical protein SNE40_023598 [Patella caerulea]|uniref:Uncharacterized protein n=1 Tax=Patella caerulea TaxID=87958 RepID=A0AAN8IZC8_PATCE